MKNALVLGGASDIGKAIVTELAKDYFVVSTYFNSSEVAKTLPGQVIRCDIRDLKQVDEVFKKAPTLDLMVTSAFPFIEGDNLDFGVYLKVLPFLTGHIYAITEAAKRMQGGKIINTLGQCVERGLPEGASYSGAFAFIHNYGNSMNGREGKAGKVAVCDLLLGPVDTREWTGLSREVVERYKKKVVDFIKPEQVAELIKLLANQPILPSHFKLDAYYGY